MEIRSTKARFLGKGIAFPPSFDKVARDMQMVEAEVDVQQSLEIILSTRPQERLLVPEFGCNLDQMLFESLDISLISLMEETVKTALVRYEPRIIVNQIKIFTDEVVEGKVLIRHATKSLRV